MEKYKFHRLMDKAELLAAMEDGAVRTFHLAGKKVCIVRTEDVFYAMNDKCPHQGASLGGGRCVNGRLVECPYHKYMFNIETGQERTGTGEAVRIYKVEEREDGVYVGFPFLGFSWR